MNIEEYIEHFIALGASIQITIEEGTAKVDIFDKDGDYHRTKSDNLFVALEGMKIRLDK